MRVRLQRDMESAGARTPNTPMPDLRQTDGEQERSDRDLADLKKVPKNARGQQHIGRRRWLVPDD